MNSESAHMLALSVGRPTTTELINGKHPHKHQNGHAFNNNHHHYNRHLPDSSDGSTYTPPPSSGVGGGGGGGGVGGGQMVTVSDPHGHYDNPNLYNSVGMDNSFPPPPSDVVTSPSRGK